MNPAQDLLEQVKAVFKQDITESTNGWWTFKYCPKCEKKDHFYFNPYKGYKCYAGKCGIRGNIKMFVQLMQECGYPIEYREPINLDELEKMYANAQREDAHQRICNIPLPREAQPVTREKVPTYFTKVRGFKADLLISLNFHYCTSGYYENRVIVPLATKADRAFLGYSTKPHIHHRKVVYPKGCEISKFMFPFNQVVSVQPRRIVLCEGTTDALRILSHYNKSPDFFFPLALLGKSMSNYQRDLVLNLFNEGITEVLVCLDGDAYNGMTKIVKELSGYLGGDRVSCIVWSDLPGSLLNSIGKSPSTIDPDDIKTQAQWKELIRHRQKASHRLL